MIVLQNSIAHRRLRIALLFLVVAPLAAQNVASPFESEAPETLLELDLGDAEVSFFGIGSWTTGIAPAAAWAFSRDPAGTIGASIQPSFPGLEPVPFTNTPNLTLSLWLLGRYFFETSIGSTLSDSTILFGYAGYPGETVQSVLVGNTAIDIGAYPFLGFGDSTGSIGQDAPGAAALFATDFSEHELLVRLSPSARDILIYASGGIVEEQRTLASDYVRNQFFALPDGGLDSLDLFAEDPAGILTGSDGKAYRRVDTAREAVVSLVDGTVGFRDPVATRILVYYESGGSPIGSVGLGADSFFGLTSGSPDQSDVRTFTYQELGSPGTQYSSLFGADAGSGDFLVTIDGVSAFVLYEPGRFAPFALASIYPEIDGATTTIETVARGAYASNLAVTPYVDGYVRVAPSGSDPRAFGSRYPFAAAGLPSTHEGLYGVAPASDPLAPSIVARSVSPAESIVLPAGYIPGSVRVTRNGVSESRFVVTDDGTVTFERPLTAADRVEVSYRTSSATGTPDLTVGTGNTFTIAPGTEVVVAAGARTRPFQSSYSTEAGENAGSAIFSGSITTDSSEWATDRRGSIAASLSGAVSAGVADTTGLLRIAGMNGGSTSIPVIADELLPGPPTTVDPDGGGGYLVSDLQSDNRGELGFADHIVTGVFGDRDLLSYDSAAAIPYDYVSGGRAGPYPARSFDADYAGVVAVYDYSITTSDTWVAGMHRLSREQDLSNVRELVVPYRVTDAAGTVDLYLQIGAIAEDADVDGLIDGGPTGIAFSDAGVELLAGAIPAAGEPLSEDANGNGVLDAEIPERVFTAAFDAPATSVSSADWQTQRFELSAADAAGLASTRSVRVLLVRPSGSDAIGQLLVGEIEALGTDVAVEAPSAAVVAVRSVPESDVSGSSLGTAFPSATNRLGTEEPRVLRADWSGLGSDTIALARAVAVPASDYEELRLFYRADTALGIGSTVTLRARSELTEIASETASVDSTNWRELVVPLPEASTSTIHEIRVEISGLDNGDLLLDEISFARPRAQFGAIAALDVTLEPALDITIGDVPVLSDVRMYQRGVARSAGFAGGTDASAGLEGTTELGARLFGVDLGLAADGISSFGATGLQLRHTIDTNPIGLPVTLSEEFRSGYGLLAAGTDHSVLFGATVPLIGQASINAGWSASDLQGSTSGATRDWDLSLGHIADITDDHRTDLTISAAVGESTAEDPLEGLYPSRWAASYARVLPADEAIGRNAGLSLDSEFAGRAVGVSATAAIGVSSDLSTRERGGSADATLAIPVSIGGATLEVQLARSLDLVAEGLPGATIGDDIREGTVLISEAPLILTQIPIAELFLTSYPETAASQTSGFAKAVYEPSARVDLTRQIASSPWSLVVPTSAIIEVARPVARELDSVFSSYEILASTGYVAPNLFGRLGTNPLVSFYDTDEFVTALGLESSGGDGSVWTHTLSADGSVRLLWTEGRELSLAYDSSVDLLFFSPFDAQMELAYERPGSPGPLADIRLPPAFAGESISLDHLSSLEIEAFVEDQVSLYGRLEHEIAVSFGERGSVRLYGGLGLGRLSDATSPTTLIGVRAGIEGSLNL